MGKIKDLSGKRFGRLTVLERADDYVTASGRRKIAWTCVCDCGKKKVATSNDLLRGHTKSCGCLANEIAKKTIKSASIAGCEMKLEVRGELIGKRFGSLAVIGMAGKADCGSYRVLCQCDCGEIMPVIINSLKTGNTTKCQKCRQRNLIEHLHQTEFVDGTKLSGLTQKVRCDNSTGVKGVYLEKRSGKFVAEIRLRGKKYWIGKYSSLEDAKKARERAEEELFDPILEAHGRKKEKEG